MSFVVACVGIASAAGNDEVLDASGDRQVHHETNTFVNLRYFISIYMHQELERKYPALTAFTA